MFDSKITTRSAWGQMTSINSSSAPGFIPIPCPSHPEYSITNICKATNCIQPLCPECIANHVQLHQQSKKPAKIQNIITTRTTCIEQLAVMKYQAQKQIDETIASSTGNIQQFVQAHQKRLDIAYKKVMKILDDLFTAMNKQMQVISNAYISQKQKKQKQAKMKLSPMNDYLTRINEYKQQLQSDDYIPALIQLLNEPPRKPKYEAPTETQNFGSVQINQKYLQDIKEDINKFVKVVVNCKDEGFKNRVEMNKSSFNGSNNMKFSRLQRSRGKDQRDGSQSKISDSRRSNSKKKIFGCQSVISDIKPSSSSRIQYTNNNSIYQNIPKTEQSSYKKLPSYNQQPSNSPTIKYSSYSSPIKITKSSSFMNKNSSLWYFKEGTKYAFKAPLQSIQAGFQRIQLNINFVIPQNHKTVILSNGNTILLGGQTTQGITNKVYVLNQQNFTIKQLAPMITNRSLFGVALLPQYIYVAGGLRLQSSNKWSNKKPINEVQRYNLKQNRWQKTVPLTQPSYDFSMHGLNSNKIIKFGGLTQSRIFLHKIDILDIYQNRWISLQPDNRFILTSNPGLTQISNQSLLIFGGRISTKNQKSSRCYLLSQQQNGNSFVISQGPQLYNQATFQSAFINEGAVLAIQNNQVANRNKLIMGYKYDQWKFISC